MAKRPHWKHGQAVHRQLEQRIAPQTVGVVAVLVAGRDHQQAKANDVGQSMRDLPGIARILQAGGHALGHTQAPLDLAQRQNAAVRRQQAAVEIDDNFLAETGDRPGSGSIESDMADVPFLKQRCFDSIPKSYAKSVS